MVARIKGVLLCGGEGTRLRPMTSVINKHLIRVVDFPMAEWPLFKMIESGIQDIMIVTGGENFAAVVKYFGSGVKWGCRFVYAIQDKAGGIAQALSLAEKFIGHDKMMVCLGDNLWNMNIKDYVNNFHTAPTDSAGLFIIQSDTPERFGVLQFGQDGPVDVIEKPKKFVSNWVVAGVYLYGHEVFKIIKDLHPSLRGELEITAVNRFYIKSGKARIIRMSGWWSDCGTIDSLMQTEELIKNDRLISTVHP